MHRRSVAGPDGLRPKSSFPFDHRGCKVPLAHEREDVEAMIRSRARVPATMRRPKGAPVALREVLVLSKRCTRFELMCWELNVDERLARPAWELALQNGLLEAAGVDAATGKTMFTLSERGRSALQRLPHPAARDSLTCRTGTTRPRQDSNPGPAD